MIHFDKIVMTENEPPKKRGTLWLRPKRTVINDPDSKERMKLSLSINFYGNNGWESIVDFDTKYVLSTSSSNNASTKVLDISEKPYDNGSVENELIFSLYEGNRTPGNNKNIVTEQGLKTQIDALNNQITQLAGTINNMSNTIANINSRLEQLENN